MNRNQVLQQLHARQSNTPVTGTQAASTRNCADAFKDRARRDQGHAAEGRRISEAYQRGEMTDVAKMMLARQEASVSFEATLQVRNKLLSAYQDIMRLGVQSSLAFQSDLSEHGGQLPLCHQAAIANLSRPASFAW